VLPVLKTERRHLSASFAGRKNKRRNTRKIR
jgi:hypothetical protein